MVNARQPVSYRGLQKTSMVLTAVLLLTLLTGCMVGPDFAPPQVSMPGSWAESGAGAEPEPVTEAEKTLATWWTEFSDPTLISLVEQAVRSNLDLQAADSRIRQAKAARAITFSGVGPTVAVAGSYQRGRSPLNAGRSEGVTSNFYQSGFDAGWELDIFGGIRRGVEAADADVSATVESRRDILVTLTAEVALNYINLRAYQQRILIARKNLAAQRHTAELTRRRFEGGFVSGLDVANANAQVAATSSDIPTLESLARQTIYNLSALLGMEPAALVQELSSASSIPAAPQGAPLGVPSELLRRRPDIRQAEENIHAATARIGVATADLFPRFTITGAAGFQGGDLGSIYNWSDRFWSFGPSITLPLFTMGRIRSNIELRKAIEDETFVAYRQIVLAALQEVENALISLTKEQERRSELVKAVNANNKAVDLATNLYTQGQTDFLNVLAAQRSLLVSEDALARSTGALSTDMVALYKALGGGWNEEVILLD